METKWIETEHGSRFSASSDLFVPGCRERHRRSTENDFTQSWGKNGKEGYRSLIRGVIQSSFGMGAEIMISPAASAALPRFRGLRFISPAAWHTLCKSCVDVACRLDVQPA